MDDVFYSKKDIRSVDNSRPSLLLHPNIPKPLHGMAPRELLGTAWWNRERKEAFKKQHYCCAACGVPKEEARYFQWLEGHEVYDTNYPLGRSVYVETVGLCHSCHNFIHSGRLQILVDKGEIPSKKQADIIRHGRTILAKAGLRKHPYIGPCAKWRDWRLVLFGKEYHPRLKSFKAWAKHYGHEIPKKEKESISDYLEDWVPSDMEEY